MTRFQKLDKSGYYLEVQSNGKTVGWIDAYYGPTATSGPRFSLRSKSGLLTTGTLQHCKETALNTWAA